MTSNNESKEAMEPQGELRWQCQKCGGDTFPGTENQYLQACRKHPKRNGCGIVLIDETGTVVADNKEDAIRKGIFAKKPSEPSGPQRIPREGDPLLRGFFKTQTVELDPKVQLYHQVFIDEGLIPTDTKLGQFILGAIETLLDATGRKLALVQRKKGA